MGKTITKPSAEVHFPGKWGNVLEHIEHCARLCYKSEGKIEPGSAERFVKMLVKRGHLAAIEHYRFVLVIPEFIWDRIWSEYLRTHNVRYRSAVQTVIVSAMNPAYYIISCNARNLIEMHANSSERAVKHIRYIMSAIAHNHPEIVNTLFPEENVNGYDWDTMGIAEISPDMFDSYLGKDQMRIHGWCTAHIVTDRGIGNEIVRHRPASYCQESTRYCNYGGRGIEFVRPSNIGEYELPFWLSAMADAEEAYDGLIQEKATPQTARGVLPLNTKTELCMTCTYSEWEHFIELRESPAAHPDIRPIATSIREQIPIW